MGGIANGIAYHGGFIPYAGTFLNFSDYMRGSVRLAALAGLHVIYVWTHDSVGLGEDGPTHQPVEHYAALRAMPNLWFVRPGRRERGGRGVGAGGRARQDGPVALALTRQKLPTLPGTRRAAREGVASRRLRPARGRAAVPSRDRPDPDRDGLRAAAGGRGRRAARGRRDPARGSSRCPCWELFERQDAAYRESRAAAGRPRGVTSRPARRSAGSAGSATRARSSGSTTSARRAPARHDLRAVRLHRRSRRRRRPAGRPRGPPRADPDARSRPPARRRSVAAGHALGHGGDAEPARSIEPGQLSRADARRVRGGPRGSGLKAELLAARRGRLGHDLVDLGGDGSDPNDDYPDFAERLGRRDPDGRGGPRHPRSAAPASARASPRTRSAACARRSATTPTRPTRASSTTT